jgi:hypothetical protein
MGKDGKIYLLDRARLGGLGGALAVEKLVRGPIIDAAAAYTTALGTYVVFRALGGGVGCPGGAGGDLVAVRLSPTAPPRPSIAWCVEEVGLNAPMVTSTDGRAEAVVWSLAAGGDGRLHAYDGDTGAIVHAPQDGLGGVRKFHTPIVGGGRIFVGTDVGVKRSGCRRRALSGASRPGTPPAVASGAPRRRRRARGGRSPRTRASRWNTSGVSTTCPRLAIRAAIASIAGRRANASVQRSTPGRAAADPVQRGAGSAVRCRDVDLRAIGHAPRSSGPVRWWQEADGEPRPGPGDRERRAPRAPHGGGGHATSTHTGKWSEGVTSRATPKPSDW